MNRKYYLLSTLVLLTISTSLISCKKEEEQGYNRQLILENVGNNIVLPLLSDLQTHANALAQAGTNFNDQPSLANLTNVQEAWKTAVLSWEKAIVFNTGPIKVQDMIIKIDFNPVRPNLVTNVLNDNATLDQAYISNAGAAAKGFPALEYLLFDRTLTNDQILALFTTDTQAARRRAYVKAITEDISEKTTTILQEWQTSGQNYLATFISNSQGGNDAVNALANNMIETAENITNTKLADPLGVKLSGGTIQPESAEAWRSGTSLEHMLANLETLEQVFTGANGEGFDDYLDALKSTNNGQSLSEAIKQQINTTREALNGISPSVYEAVIGNSAQVQVAYEAAQQLVLIIKVDMMNALGGIVTFNDNDGD